MVEHDPLAPMIAQHPTGNGHIYLLAEPCSAVAGREDGLDLQNVVIKKFGNRHGMGTLSSLRHNARDPQGLAMSSPIGDGPVQRKYEDDVVHLLCRDEDSSLEFVSGGGSAFRLMDRGGEGLPIEVVGTHIIVPATLQFFDLVRELSLNHWGYSGQWRVGVHVNNLAGKQLSFSDLWTSHQTFSGTSFTNQALIAPATWEEGAEPEARRLLAGFLRAIGQEGRTLDQVAAL